MIKKIDNIILYAYGKGDDHMPEFRSYVKIPVENEDDPYEIVTRLRKEETYSREIECPRPPFLNFKSRSACENSDSFENCDMSIVIEQGRNIYGVCLEKNDPSNGWGAYFSGTSITVPNFPRKSGKRLFKKLKLHGGTDGETRWITFECDRITAINRIKNKFPKFSHLHNSLMMVPFNIDLYDEKAKVPVGLVVDQHKISESHLPQTGLQHGGYHPPNRAAFLIF